MKIIIEKILKKLKNNFIVINGVLKKKLQNREVEYKLRYILGLILLLIYQINSNTPNALVFYLLFMGLLFT